MITFKKFPFVKVMITQKVVFNWLCLLNYPYFKKHCRLFAIDLREQEKLDADPTAAKKHYWKTKKSRFRYFKRNS